MIQIPDFLTLNLPILWQIIKSWWWLPLPFLFWRPFLFLWLWWRNEVFDSKIKRIILEIKLPREIKKPIKAMEDVFATLHTIHDPPNWREKWIEGQFQLSFSLEIVSIGGEIHFYIRTPEMYKKLVEATIYAQYPEVEIFEVPDYTKNVPQDVPNKEWDIWGMNLDHTKPDCYPIKTYKKFEIETQSLEEKRVDPLSNLLEGMSVLQPGEQLWFQMIIKPIRDEKPWVKEGKATINKLVKRPEKPKPKPMIQEALDILISGKPSTPPTAEKEVIPPEMKLTPGEREVVQAIEEKISKFGFDCVMRYVYVGKREVFFKPRVRIPFGYLKTISSETLNGFKPLKGTITKVKSPFFWFLDKRRVYLRQRKIFRGYVRRVGPLFPRSGGSFVLNTEELATIYHFPGEMVAPAGGLERIEAKKAEPPVNLPIE